MKKKYSKGFTLIELVVVIIVIGILATLAIPNLFILRKQTTLTITKNNIMQLQYSSESHYLEYNYWPINHVIEPLTKETLIDAADEFINDKGENVELEEDLYYVIDYKATEKYSPKPDDDLLYVIQDSTKKVFALENLTNKGKLLYNDILTRKPKVIDIAIGEEHALFLKNDGTVWGSGGNYYGELNINSNKDYFSQPVKIAENAAGITAGRKTSIILMKDGTLINYGTSLIGVFDESPQQIPDIYNVKQLAFNWEHGLALTPDGKVWGFGEGGYGQVGNDKDGYNYLPEVIRKLPEIKNIITGQKHSFAVDENENIWVWGDNYYGNLGTGVSDTYYEPIQATEFNNTKKLSSYSYHTVELKNDKTVWTIGYNKYGETCSDVKGTLFQSNQIATDAKDVAAGFYYTLIVKNDGTVWSCGYNYYGQLGDGTVNSRSSLVRVQNIENIKNVYAGEHFSFAVEEDGTVWGWGANINNVFGELQYKQTIPVKIQFPDD